MAVRTSFSRSGYIKYQGGVVGGSVPEMVFWSDFIRPAVAVLVVVLVVAAIRNAPSRNQDSGY